MTHPILPGMCGGHVSRLVLIQTVSAPFVDVSIVLCSEGCCMAECSCVVLAWHLQLSVLNHTHKHSLQQKTLTYNCLDTAIYLTVSVH